MQTPPKPEKRKQEILTCDTCGIEVNSQQMMDAHIRGQKHIKKMKLKVIQRSTFSWKVLHSIMLIQTASGTNTPTNETVATPADAASQNEPNVPVTTPIVTSTPSSDKSALQSMNELAKHNKVTHHKEKK